MNANINSLDLRTVIEVTDSQTTAIKKIELDFTDRRFSNRLLKLIKRYSNMEDELKLKFASADGITDPIDKMIAVSDAEIEVLEEFKDNVNDVFGFDIVTELFGDCLPSVERYFEFFEALTPYVLESNKRENERIAAVKDKYGIDRIEKSGEE